jgi:hypothetical protein
MSTECTDFMSVSPWACPARKSSERDLVMEESGTAVATAPAAPCCSHVGRGAVALSPALQRIAEVRHFSEVDVLTILAPCLGPDDLTRVDALRAALLPSATDGSGPHPHPANNATDAAVRSASHLLYGEIYNFEKWLPQLTEASLTHPAAVLPLETEAEAALLEGCTRAIDLYWKVNCGHEPPPAAGWLQDPRIWNELTRRHRAVLSRLASTIDTAVADQASDPLAPGQHASQSHHRQFFVKLSTRSPKDSLMLTHRRKTAVLTATPVQAPHGVASHVHGTGAHAQLPTAAPPQPRRLPKALRGKVSARFLEANAAVAEGSSDIVAVLDPSDGVDGCRVDPTDAEQVAMRNSTGWEALDLLCGSQRITDDLARPHTMDADVLSVLHGEGARLGGPLHIIARPWLDIPRWTELRGFVLGRSLTALSQYFTAEHYPELWADRHAIAARVVEFVKARLGPAMPMENAVVDLVWSPETSDITVIELNPFGRCSGGALFNWFDDRDVLFGDAAFEFRLREPP